MCPNDLGETNERLYISLQAKHGNRFQVLDYAGKKLAEQLNGMAKFKLTTRPCPKRHIGVVIVDGVLSVGHDFERQVRPSVQLISGRPEASSTEGFIGLFEQLPIYRIINWWEQSTADDLLSVAEFFKVNGLNEFDQLKMWLCSESNRDKLLTKNSGLCGSVFRIGEKTADYFRVLVGCHDAVAVDRGIRYLLRDLLGLPVSAKSKRWPYAEKKAIVQIAAIKMGVRPVDLDGSIYNHYVSTMKGC